MVCPRHRKSPAHGRQNHIPRAPYLEYIWVAEIVTVFGYYVANVNRLHLVCGLFTCIRTPFTADLAFSTTLLLCSGWR